eukprot:TRINITY_DN6085_c0_g1_i3.p1 TRINITY_DN6085_c0_g1~~TRINITY_DN6085_c0_g1_i3.p1  ORF type:complete len:661 (+),score=141.37 TRINITY_DN6085_c0_g1_i3:152-1984(+)
MSPSNVLTLRWIDWSPSRRNKSSVKNQSHSTRFMDLQAFINSDGVEDVYKPFMKEFSDVLLTLDENGILSFSLFGLVKFASFHLPTEMDGFADPSTFLIEPRPDLQEVMVSRIVEENACVLSLHSMKDVFQDERLANKFAHSMVNSVRICKFLQTTLDEISKTWNATFTSIRNRVDIIAGKEDLESVISDLLYMRTFDMTSKLSSGNSAQSCNRLLKTTSDNMKLINDLYIRNLEVLSSELVLYLSELSGVANSFKGRAMFSLDLPTALSTIQLATSWISACKSSQFFFRSVQTHVKVVFDWLAQLCTSLEDESSTAQASNTGSETLLSSARFLRMFQTKREKTTLTFDFDAIMGNQNSKDSQDSKVDPLSEPKGILSKLSELLDNISHNDLLNDSSTKKDKPVSFVIHSQSALFVWEIMSLEKEYRVLISESDPQALSIVKIGVDKIGWQILRLSLPQGLNLESANFYNDDVIVYLADPDSGTTTLGLLELGDAEFQSFTEFNTFLSTEVEMLGLSTYMKHTRVQKRSESFIHVCRSRDVACIVEGKRMTAHLMNVIEDDEDEEDEADDLDGGEEGGSFLHELNATKDHDIDQHLDGNEAMLSESDHPR